MNSDSPRSGLAYADEWVSFGNAPLAAWGGREREPDVVLAGPCPRCSHRTEAVVVAHGSGLAQLVACACAYEHPGQPHSRPGCGAHWSVFPDDFAGTADRRPGRLELGNELWPSSFVLRDDRFNTLAEGVTPASIELAAGLYQAELDDRRGELFHVRPGSTHDARALATTVDTIVPVHNARQRRQPAAERVTLLTAGLRDRGAASGLITVQPSYNWTMHLLDDRHHLVETRPTRFDDWAIPLEPGGWVLRMEPFKSSAPVVELPVWIAAGYHTVLFLPGQTDPGLAATSCHLVPSGSVWTGFDGASALLERALERLRAGRRPFGTAPATPDFARLAPANPMLALLRALDLYTHPADGISPDPLVERLDRAVPGHPDLVAMRRHRARSAGLFDTAQEHFPPTTATGQRLIRAAAAASDAVAPNSLLDHSLRVATATGPYVSWPVRPDDPLFRTDSETDLWQSSVPRHPAAGLLPIRIPPLGRHTLMFLTGLRTVLRLRRLPDDEWLRTLRRGSTDQAEHRLRSYLADLVVAGRSELARAMLLGFAIPAAAAAAGLTRAAAADALESIQRDLAQRR